MLTRSASDATGLPDGRPVHSPADVVRLGTKLEINGLRYD